MQSGRAPWLWAEAILLWWAATLCSRAQHADMPAMFGFVLDEMAQDPLRRHVVPWQIAGAPELLHAHVAEDDEQTITHASEPFEMSVKRLGDDRRETALGVTRIGRKQRGNFPWPGFAAFQHLSIEPVELDQRDVIEKRAYAVAALKRHPVQNGLCHAGYGSYGLLTSVLKGPQPAPDIGIAAIGRDNT